MSSTWQLRPSAPRQVVANPGYAFSEPAGYANPMMNDADTADGLYSHMPFSQPSDGGYFVADASGQLTENNILCQEGG